MQAVFRPEALNELLAAQAWYALRTPLAFPCIEAKFRHVVTRKFPYSIVYYASEAELVIVLCFHHRRRPGSWLENIPG
jgi:hypothetical protein